MHNLPITFCLLFALFLNPFAFAATKKRSKSTNSTSTTAAPTPSTEPPPPPPPEPISPEEDETWGQTIWRDFISPVTTPAWIPLVSGAVLTTTVYDMRGKWENPLQSRWSDHRPFGATSNSVGDILGQLIPNIAYTAGMYSDYWWGSHSRKNRERAILMFRATTYSGLVATVVKYSVHEQRPNGSDRKSFPSGHATSSFAFASIIGAEHEWYWSVPAYALATFIGATRISSNMHRLHDVIGGATIGLSYGLGVYYHWHENDNKPRNTVYQVLPTDGLDGAIATMTYSF